MTEFNFDIDQIANNTVAKVDKTTQIIGDKYWLRQDLDLP